MNQLSFNLVVQNIIYQKNKIKIKEFSFWGYYNHEVTHETVKYKNLCSEELDLATNFLIKI